MRLTLPFTAARSLAYTSIGMRVVLGVFIHMPWLYNSGWISILLATALCAPLVWAAGMFMRANRAMPVAAALEARAGVAPTRVACAIFILVMLYEGAAMAEELIYSARYVAFANTSPVLLLLPLMAAAVAAALLNGQSIGGAARLWLKVLPLIMLIVFLLQLKSYRAQWLAPVLGPGCATLARGTVRVSGLIAPIAILWLCSEPDERMRARRAPLMTTLLVIGAVCAAFAVTQGMMSPASVGASLTRTFQLDKLLSNGREPLSLQFPLTLLWYSGLVLGTTSCLFLAAKLAQLVFPRLDGRIAVALAGAAISALALLGNARRGLLSEGMRWTFIAVAAPFFPLLLSPLVGKGGKKPCASPK